MLSQVLQKWKVLKKQKPFVAMISTLNTHQGRCRRTGLRWATRNKQSSVSWREDREKGLTDLNVWNDDYAN